MAEGFLKALLRKDEKLSAEFAAFSAGVAAYDGDPASIQAIETLQTGWGIDISGHRAACLMERIIEDSHLVLAMTRSHKNHILSLFPGARQKVYTLKEYSYNLKPDPAYEPYDYKMDVTDPFGMPSNVYNQCASEIKEAVDRLFEKIRQ